jgi:hypothetical protein
MKENSTATEIRQTEAETKSELRAIHPTEDLQDEGKPKDCDVGDVKKTQNLFDPEVVQIKAGKAEVSVDRYTGQGNITLKSSVVFRLLNYLLF